MPEEPSDHLAPWIVAPLLFVVVLVFATLSFSSSGCGKDAGSGGIVGFVIAAAAAAVIAGFGLFRLATMARHREFSKRRDGWIFAGILVAAAVGVLDQGWGFLLLGFFLLTVFTLPALAAAAVTGKGVKAVGILLPIYLFGAAFLCVMVGWFILVADSGAFC
ncbi:MAG: hypothetical protein M3335_02180 [Actinomycetota bacterium]|nr:hypothetical protein [Actinomycetota bacterium]